jgi:hypothetical protein
VRLRDRLATDDDERRPCAACHGTGLISPDAEPPPDDHDLFDADAEADRLGLPPLPATVRHPERMSPASRFALRLFPSLEACE